MATCNVFSMLDMNVGSRCLWQVRVKCNLYVHQAETTVAAEHESVALAVLCLHSDGMELC